MRRARADRFKSCSVIQICRVVFTHCVVFIPTGSHTRGRDVAVYVFDQLSLSSPFYSALVSVSVFMSLSTVFSFINSPDNSPISQFVLPVFFLPYWSFQL